ncbi:stAR-related lipid transfer protein 7, mitochondrial-like isoform X2 [Argiope bruennichi]|uniref:stAR-related lipid transfer protein 7, mitochondrial-like isoform X2 n=1 Tax=Argiope bruennichi TaxID=94029 RepID=UPI002494161E|nr:stAR-related lipid transfer protein 7, mitochondrial-like isoform X2 [Argiope bruennichi]
MNGSFVYNKIARNFRKCYRCCNENEFSLELKRHFSFSASIDPSKRRVFPFKSIFELDTRKKLWYDFKLQCNEKLVVLGEILTNQCNFIASQRVRRLSQMWNLYNQLYTEQSIKRIFSQLAKTLRSKRRPFSVLLGATLFKWEEEKITDEEIYNFRALDEYLLEEMICLRNIISVYQSNDDSRRNTLPGQNLVNKLVEDGWEPVIQKECIQVWRKAFPNSYLYEYKVMGTFYDVPARTFFAVQTDIEYRKQWDKLVIKLDIIDKEDVENGCEVMHWVMHYPYPMYSREYVYIRRAVISPETNTMVLVSRATDHPACPVNNKYVRVTEYSSRMVIRPHRTYDDNGFDYVLTYFDDPQAAFPTPAYNWMASSGVPDFVEKLHNAARELHKQEQRNISSLSITKSQNQKESCSSNNLEYMYM